MKRGLLGFVLGAAFGFSVGRFWVHAIYIILIISAFKLGLHLHR